jgi:hypothetical protein
MIFKQAQACEIFIQTFLSFICCIPGGYFHVGLYLQTEGNHLFSRILQPIYLHIYSPDFLSIGELFRDLYFHTFGPSS